jgi:hypothetical protein
MHLIFRQIPRFAAAAGVLVVPAGCNRVREVGFDTKMKLGSVSLVDRCSDFMSRAFPNGDIDLVGSHVDTGMQSASVTVQGTRNGVSDNSSYARSVAVECRFEGGVLTSFRWTAGPIRAATTGQAP